MSKNEIKPDWFFPVLIVAIGSWIAGMSVINPFPVCLFSVFGLFMSFVGGYILHWDFSHWEWTFKKSNQKKETKNERKVDGGD